MAQHYLLGREGEAAARAYLLNKGIHIRHANWHCGHLELDIVAEDDKQLIVIEVKTRSNLHFQRPEEAVTWEKIRRIVSATQNYLRYYRITKDVRFDVMSVVPSPSGFLIHHIEDAFLPPVM